MNSPLFSLLPCTLGGRRPRTRARSRAPRPSASRRCPPRSTRNAQRRRCARAPGQQPRVTSTKICERDRKNGGYLPRICGIADLKGVTYASIVYKDSNLHRPLPSLLHASSAYAFDGLGRRRRCPFSQHEGFAQKGCVPKKSLHDIPQRATESASCKQSTPTGSSTFSRNERGKKGDTPQYEHRSQEAFHKKTAWED
jgi:hypothetical protein